MMRRRWTAIALLLIAGRAGADVPLPDVHVGDKWTFRTLDGFTNEVQVEATSQIVEITDREIVVQVHNLTKDKRALRYFDREWNAVDNDDGKYDPYYPEFRFPMTGGTHWEQKFTYLPATGGASAGFVKATVAGPEKVDVPAGTFDAYRIERDQESRASNESAAVSKIHMTTWYAPSVRHFVKREWTTFRDGRVRAKSIVVLVSSTLAGH